ncbi:MAG: hypothetical protein MK171_01775 [Pirellulales bacterium]|nr:hypothetical protein [Pirellulales bacterium]
MSFRTGDCRVDGLRLRMRDLFLRWKALRKLFQTCALRLASRFSAAPLPPTVGGREVRVHSPSRATADRPRKDP